jgi:hypothetical protein
MQPGRNGSDERLSDLGGVLSYPSQKCYRQIGPAEAEVYGTRQAGQLVTRQMKKLRRRPIHKTVLREVGRERGDLFPSPSLSIDASKPGTSILTQVGKG